MLVDSCPVSRVAIPLAFMLAQPLQNAEVATLSRCTADRWTPLTAILMGNLQHCQVAYSGCRLARQQVQEQHYSWTN